MKHAPFFFNLAESTEQRTYQMKMPGYKKTDALTCGGAVFRRILVLCLLLLFCTASTLFGKRTYSASDIFPIPEFADFELSPDGLKLAFSAYERGKPTVFVLHIDSGNRRKATFEEDSEIAEIHWIDEENIFVVLDDLNGQFAECLNLDTKRMRSSVMEFSGLKLIEFLHPLYAREGAFLGIYEREADGVISVYQVWNDERQPKLQGTLDSSIYHWILTTGGDILYGVKNDAGEAALVKWNREAQDWDLPVSIPQDFRPIELFKNEYIIGSHTMNGDFRGLAVCDPSTGAFIEDGKRHLRSHDLSEGQFIYSNRNRQLLGVHYDEQMPGIFLFYPKHKQLSSAINELFPGQAITFFGEHMKRDWYYFIVESDVEVPVLYRLELDTMQLRALRKQYDIPEGIEFLPTKSVSFRSRGNEITGYLTLAEDSAGSERTMILIREEPFSRDTWRFNPVVQYFALNGYNVLQLNFRGSTGFGAKFENHPVAEVCRMAVEDTVSAANWLVYMGYADPAKMVLAGGRFGANVSMKAAIDYPDMWQAVVGYSGIYDFLDMPEGAISIDNYAQRNWLSELFNSDVSTDELRELSPFYSVEGIKAPVLLYHGKDDISVPLWQSVKMHEALSKQGIPVELKVEKWGSRGLPDYWNRGRFYKQVLRFLDKNTE